MSYIHSNFHYWPFWYILISNKHPNLYWNFVKMCVSYVKKQKGIYGIKFPSLSGLCMQFYCSLELITLLLEIRVTSSPCIFSISVFRLDNYRKCLNALTIFNGISRRCHVNANHSFILKDLTKTQYIRSLILSNQCAQNTSNFDIKLCLPPSMATIYCSDNFT